MANQIEQLRVHRQTQATPSVAESVAGSASPDTAAISPQDFYREMTERPDVRRILTRLAQVKDSDA